VIVGCVVGCVSCIYLSSLPYYMHHKNIQIDILIQHISQEISQYVLVGILNKHTVVVGVEVGAMVEGLTVGWEVVGSAVEGLTVGWEVTGDSVGAVVGCFLWLIVKG
jgi:hypothetical protein